MANPGQAFDPIKFKETTREQWENAAEAWYRWGPTLQTWLGPVTEVMLDLARIRHGDRVLDVAAGAGEPALSAAKRVGPSGYVLATDISANLLTFATKIARERGLGKQNFETRVMDGENLELVDTMFDVALSRLGLVYFPDRQRGLSEMRRVLKPGGRAIVASFTTPGANRFFSIPITIIRRRAQLPAPLPGMPGPFSLGAQGEMEDALRRARFRDIETRVIAAPLRLSSAVECVRFERESFGALQQMLAGVSKEEQEAVWSEVEQEFHQFEGSRGFETPSELIVGAGVK
jgi:ubiquinone/menaquinone biosynthesis C-methylase UbiE